MMSGDYFVNSCHPTLLPQHKKMLDASNISNDLIKIREYRSVTSKQELKRLGFNTAQSQCVPALVIPTYRPCGEPGLIQMRPDLPRRFPDGRTAKYEMPGKERMVLDVPPPVRVHIRNPKVPLYIPEGIKKGDSLASAGACAAALLGVTCWRGTNEYGGKTSLDDWADVALNDRDVYIVFDSDVMRKLAVYYALRDLATWLKGRGARVYFIYLPEGPDGAKTGVDDYLTNKTLQDLNALATPVLRPGPNGDAEAEKVYEETAGGLVWNRPTNNGVIRTPLTNFAARIVADISADDGVEAQREYLIEGRRGERHSRFTVPFPAFDALGWPAEHLGVGASVCPGFGLKEHVRFAIRELSNEAPETRLYTHTGWREFDGKQWGYLHGGGVIGAAGDIGIRLSGSLQKYELADAPTGEALQAVVRSCLGLLDVAPARIAFPLLAAPFRAALCSADFTLALVGPSGAFKSELASLAQRFFGVTMDANHLPASWSSTENALEDIAFRVKDALLVIDDFAPTPGDAQRLHTKADRVLRAQGNNSGRQRMRADGTLRPDRPPRGMILMTGEDVPQGKSLKARLFITEVGPNEVNARKLTACQKDAAAGGYAQTMAAFLAWLAPRYETERARFAPKIEEWRGTASANGSHRRTPEIVAELFLGLEYFLMFAAEISAISQAEYKELGKAGWAALLETAAAQGLHQQASDPAKRFLELLQAAISSERAYVADKKGYYPDEAQEAWGWRSKVVGAGEHERQEWQPMGECIGYIVGPDLYLIPDVAYNMAKRMGTDGGEGIALTPTTLFKRLKEAKMLISTDEKREINKIRRTLKGKSQEVLHLSAASLVSLACQEPDKPDKPAISANE